MINPAAWGAALLRVVLGVIFVLHGYYAYSVIGRPAVAGYTTRMGFPPALGDVLAWYLILAHAVGGALLVVGLFTRVAAFAQTPIMASALFLLHWPQGFFLHAAAVETPNGQRLVTLGYEYALLVLVATVACGLIGPGIASIDSGWEHRRPLEIP